MFIKGLAIFSVQLMSLRGHLSLVYKRQIFGQIEVFGLLKFSEILARYILSFGICCPVKESFLPIFPEMAPNVQKQTKTPHFTNTPRFALPQRYDILFRYNKMYESIWKF